MNARTINVDDAVEFMTDVATEMEKRDPLKAATVHHAIGLVCHHLADELEAASSLDGPGERENAVKLKGFRRWLDGELRTAQQATSDPPASSRQTGDRQQGDKAAILAHYADCEPQRFTQLDGWRDAGQPGDIMGTDYEGDAVMAGHTWELRASPPGLAVRVHIAAGTDHGTAVRLLGKLLGWLAGNPGLLLDAGTDPGPVGAGSGAGGHGESNNTGDDSMEADPHFGGCPECGRTNGYLNVGRDHWFYCDRHRTRWYVGSNLFSNWRHESDDQHARNRAKLAGYREVAPTRPGGEQ